MKVAIITDQHFGARGDSVQCLDYYENFYSTIFFPKLLEQGIKHILILGDTFDRRKFVNFNTLARAKRMFFDVAYDNDIMITMIAGNHDTYYKNTNEVNSPELTLAEYVNINIVTKPETIDVYGVPICFLPWICADNYTESMNEIKNTKSDICMGHLEIAGFAMYRGAESHDGLSKESFSKFDMVFSGHYHHKSDDGHVFYLGNPYELTWQDYNDPRGFHIFDLQTRKLEFVQNTFSLFERFEYDDSMFDPDGIDTSYFADKYVKIIVVNKTDFYKFDKFINRLYQKNPLEVKIVEDFSEFAEGEVDETINLEDTSSVLSNYIDSLETEVDKEKVKSFMKSLYTEALNRDVA
jgi:DNA repair exonuclease SbcCD nuclease subunit